MYNLSLGMPGMPTVLRSGGQQKMRTMDAGMPQQGMLPQRPMPMPGMPQGMPMQGLPGVSPQSVMPTLPPGMQGMPPPGISLGMPQGAPPQSAMPMLPPGMSPGMPYGRPPQLGMPMQGGQTNWMPGMGQMPGLPFGGGRPGFPGMPPGNPYAGNQMPMSPFGIRRGIMG